MKLDAEDSPDAIEAVLRYIYTFDYQEKGNYGHSKPRVWTYHFEVARVADKYQLPEVTKSAVLTAESNVAHLHNIEHVTTALRTLPQYGDVSNKVDKLVKGLRQKHILALLQLPELRADLISDPAQMERYFDQFLSAFQLVRAHTTKNRSTSTVGVNEIVQKTVMLE